MKNSVAKKCHQSCSVALAFCTKLCRKLPVSRCSFSLCTMFVLCWNMPVLCGTALSGKRTQWDVCKSPGFPSNRVAAGQVDPPAVRITMVCSLFACCLSASEAFLFLSGVVCWVFSNAYTKEEHLLVFFSWLVIGEGPELLDTEVRSSIAPLRRGTCRRSKSRSL